MDINTFIKKTGVTPEELAIAGGCTVMAISNYRRGERIPRKEIGNRLIQYSGDQITWDGLVNPTPSEVAA